jgi:hypothetical protein
MGGMSSSSQVAYKDSDGTTSYQNITSKYYSTVSYTGSSINSSDDSYYTLPVTDSSDRMESFDSLSVTDTDWSKSKTKAVTASHKKDATIKNANSYPTKLSQNETTGRNIYDYTITIQSDILKSIESIKKNLNVPSAYSRRELNKKFHEEFNRFHVQYPDYFMNNTIGYVFFTRPDLNIMSQDDNGAYSTSDFADQVLNDSQLSYIVKASPETAKLLTVGYSSDHYFNPLLSNTVMSLDVSDESIDTLETGETFTGFKTQYAKSNIRSMTAGTISLTFPETYNAAITHMHQLWCGYESGVYRGSLKPKDTYIWNKELDYACDIYYFLVDAEDLILRYWCKYTGCFPLNVNKSVFSFSGDTQINHPSLNVSYAYFAREDMSLVNLNEFNNSSIGTTSNFRYKANYIPSLGSGGNTWSGTPFVDVITQGTGFSRDAQLYSLRFRT